MSPNTKGNMGTGTGIGAGIGTAKPSNIEANGNGKKLVEGTYHVLGYNVKFSPKYQSPVTTLNTEQGELFSFSRVIQEQLSKMEFPADVRVVSVVSPKTQRTYLKLEPIE